MILIACLAEVQEELAEGFERVRAHHGLIIYALCKLTLCIKEVMEAKEKFKKTKAAGSN